MGLGDCQGAKTQLAGPLMRPGLAVAQLIAKAIRLKVEVFVR